MVNEELKDIIEIIVDVHLVDDPTGYFTTTRNPPDINRIFLEVNRIWEQARIKFVLKNIQRETIPHEEMESLFSWNSDVSPSNIKLIDNYFVKHMITGYNGWARPNLRRTFIIDKPTVNDFRTTAHEPGHVLGLQHVAPDDRLMANGKNGELLISDEIDIARNIALSFI